MVFLGSLKLGFVSGFWDLGFGGVVWVFCVFVCWVWCVFCCFLRCCDIVLFGSLKLGIVGVLVDLNVVLESVDGWSVVDLDLEREFGIFCLGIFLSGFVCLFFKVRDEECFRDGLIFFEDLIFMVVGWVVIVICLVVDGVFVIFFCCCLFVGWVEVVFWVWVYRLMVFNLFLSLLIFVKEFLMCGLDIVLFCGEYVLMRFGVLLFVIVSGGDSICFIILIMLVIFIGVDKIGRFCMRVMFLFFFNVLGWVVCWSFREGVLRGVVIKVNVLVECLDWDEVEVDVGLWCSKL